jgi:hypothetical protein
LGLIIEAAKKVFNNMPDMKIHMGINRVADDVVAIFAPLHEEESNLVTHARRELELFGQTEEDPEFAESIIKAVKGFTSYGHSGGSAPVAIAMLHDLLQHKNLSPLTDDPKEWIHHGPEVWPDGDDKGVWQNCRNGEAFSKDGGKTYYLLSDGSNSEDQTVMYTSLSHKEDDEQS